MKTKTILLFLILIKFQVASLAQLPSLSSGPDPGRGLYVSNFFVWINSTVGIDRNVSILGVPAHETALFDYCKQNHITHIVLYDVALVIDNEAAHITGGTSSLVSEVYCDFLDDARANGITKIGVTGSTNTFFYQVQSIPVTPPIMVNQPDEANAMSSVIPFLENVYDRTDPEFPMSEFLKFFTRAINGVSNSPSTFIGCSDGKIDAFVTEFEFWNNKVNPNTCVIERAKEALWDDFTDLMDYMNTIRDFYNTTHTRKLYIETYLSNLDNFNTSTYTLSGTTCVGTNDPTNNGADDIVDYLVGTSSSVGKSERSFAAYYNPNPTKSYNDHRHQDYYDDRLVLFNSSTAATNNDYHPLFSAGSLALKPNSGGDFYGYWFSNLTLASDGTFSSIPLLERNIFRAEKIFYDAWKADGISASPKVDIYPGGVQWFASEYMVGILNNPRIFRSNSPACSDGTTPANITFEYQGPLESSIAWTFHVYDDATSTDVVTIGTSGTPNITGTYVPNSTFVNLNSIACNLLPGNYHAELKLDYQYASPTFAADYTYNLPIIVSSSPTAQLLSPSATVCEGSSVMLKANTLSGTTYQWYKGALGSGNTAGTAISGETSQFLSISAVGSFDYYCVLTGGTGCTGGTNAYSVIVTSKPVASISASTPSGCNTTLSVTVPSGHTYTYNWFDGSPAGTRTVSSDADYSVIVSENGCSTTASYNYLKFQTGSATVVPDCAGTSQSTATVSATPGTFSSSFTYTWNTTPVQYTQTATVAAGTYICTIKDQYNCSKTKTVTVTDLPLPTVLAGNDQTVCNGASVMLSGSGADTYTWDQGISNGTSFNPSSTLTYTVTGTDANGCQNEDDVIVTVNPLPTLTSLSDQTVCPGATISATSLTSTPSGADLTWSNSNTLIGLGASGTGNVPSFTSANSSTSQINGTINVTPSLNGCAGSAISYVIRVNPTPSITAPSDQTVCPGASISATSLSSTPTGATLAWTNSNTDIGLGASGGGNVPAFSTTNSTTSLINGSIDVTPTLNGCAGTAVNYVITVNPTPSITAPSNQTVCPGASMSATSLSSTPIGATLAWTNSNTDIGLGASGSGNVPAFSTTNSTTSLINGSIDVTPTLNGCAGTAVNYVITVNPTPSIIAPSNQTVCPGASMSATNLSSTPIGATLAWTNSNTDIGLGSIGSGNVPAFFTTNSTTSAINGSIDVTPTLNGCAGTAVNYVITVNPTPSITAPSNQTVCPGASMSATNLSSTPIGATLAWTNSNTDIGLGSSGSGNVPAFFTTNSTTSAINGSIDVTPTLNGCAGSAVNYLITVNPTPLVSINGNLNICTGDQTTLYAIGTSGTGIYSFSWNTSAVTSSITISPTTNTTYSVYLTDAVGCVSSTSSAQVNVISFVTPVITISSPNPAEIDCNSTYAETINFSCSLCPANTSFQVYSHPTGGGTDNAVGSPCVGCSSIAVAGQCLPIDYFYVLADLTGIPGCYTATTFQSGQITFNNITGSTFYNSWVLSTGTTCNTSSDGEITLSSNWSSLSPWIYQLVVRNSNNVVLFPPNYPSYTSVNTPFTLSGLPADNYSLTYYDSYNMRNESKSIVVNTTNATPSPVITRNPEASCNNALSIGSFDSYQWRENGSGTVLSTASTYSPIVSGNYKVTVSKNACATTSVTKNVKIWTVSSITGSDITCNSDKKYTVSMPEYSTNEFTSTWTVPSGVTKTQSGNTLTITNWGALSTVGGTISCVVSNACGNSATISFNVKGCCATASGDLNNATKTLTSTTQTLSGNFSINGILDINGSGILELDGASISLSKDAKIMVGSACTLKIVNNCHLYSCDNTKWSGIILASGAVLEVNSSMIEDAKNAIFVTPTSKFSIISSLFNNCTNSIKIQGIATNTILDGYVRNTVFTARNIDFSSPVSTLVNNLRGTNADVNIDSKVKSTLSSKAAIEVIELGASSATAIYNLKIGDESYSYINGGNLFDNHDYGVKAENSNVNIVNNYFQEMYGNDKSSNSTGIGVWAFNKPNSGSDYWLKIGGSTTNEKNSFSNCGIGVLASEYSHALLQNNTISKTAGIGSYSGSNYQGRFGIKLVNSGNVIYTCNQNAISNIHYGIWYAQNEAANIICDFNSNSIGTNDSRETCNAGIYLIGRGNYDAKTVDIAVEGNNLYDVWNGIQVLNFKNSSSIHIRNNPSIVLRKADFAHYGILVTDCRNVMISDNTDIHSSSSNNKNGYGIFLNNVPHASITCNDISNIGTCVGFFGHCPNITNNAGILHKNKFSFYSTAVSITPNTSILSQGNSSNASDNEWSHTGAGLYTRDIYNLSFPLDFHVRNISLPYKPTLVSGPVSFPLGGAISNISCSGNPVPGTWVMSLDQKDEFRKLAAEEIVFPVLPSQAKWMWSSNAYETILKDSTLTTSNDSLLLAFKDSVALANIGKFYAVEQAITAGNWSLAGTNNQAIAYENHIEDNQKTYNNYYIAFNADTTLAYDTTWMQAMLSNLEPIAAECYNTGGPATTAAKTMLSYFSNQLFDENDDCFRTPADTIIADSANTLCGLLKSYYVPETAGATYTWIVPVGTSYTQSGSSISINWGAVITAGGTITCTIMDTLGNSSYSTYTQSALITSPTCVTVTAHNTSCVTATYLSWSAPAECAAGYYFMLGTNGGGTSDPNNITDTVDIGSVTSYSLPAYLAPNTTHYFKVIPYNNSHVPVSGCSIGSFTSGNSVSFTPTLGNPYQENFNGVTAPALPCGITVSNENFPQDNFVWKTSSAASCSGINSIAIAKNTNNTTIKDDWVYSHPLNLTAGELYRVKYKSKVESSFTEGLETFVSQSANAPTMLTTSAIINSTLTSTSCVSDSGDFIAPTSSVYFVGLHTNSGANQATLFIDDLNVSLIKTTRLTSASCGDSLYTCDTLHCLSLVGATSYKFRIENLPASFSQDYTVTTANPKVYQFLGTNPLALGQNYSVAVSALVGGVWTPFGATCNIYLRPVPIRGLTGASCGTTLTDLSQLIYTNTTGICLINNYKYEFTDQSNNTIIETERNSAVTSFLMTYITAPYVKYSTTYSVRVKLKIGNTWGDYGSACNITTPASPLTKLSSAYCNYTLPTFATPVTCVSVLGAQDYRYKITGPNSYDRTFTRNSSINNWYFTWTNSSPYMQASTTYDVKVASRAGGIWSDYGDVCTITTPATLSRLADTTFLQQALKPLFEHLENNENELSLSVFPNPNNFDEEFSIELVGITESNQKIKLSILNMMGASVFWSDIITKEENRVLIQPEIRLATGVYIVEAELNGIKLRKKFVVQK